MLLASNMLRSVGAMLEEYYEIPRVKVSYRLDTDLMATLTKCLVQFTARQRLPSLRRLFE